LPGGNCTAIRQAQQGLHFAPDPRDDRSADKGEVVRLFGRLQERHCDLDLKGINLPTESIALDLHVHQSKQGLIAPDFFGEQDRARAGAPDSFGLSKNPNRLQQVIRNHQLPDSSRLAAWDDQTLQTFQLFRQTHFCYISPEFLEADAVFTKIALQG